MPRSAGTSRSPSRSNSATGGGPSGGRRMTNRSLRDVVCSMTSSSSTVTRTPPTMSLIRLNKRRAQHAEAGEPDHAEQPGDPGVVEDLAALQLVALPTELREPALDVVDGAGVRRHVPQQHAGRQQHPVQHDAEHQRHLERAPRVDVAHHPRDLANPRPPADAPEAPPRGRPPTTGIGTTTGALAAPCHASIASRRGLVTTCRVGGSCSTTVGVHDRHAAGAVRAPTGRRSSPE